MTGKSQFAILLSIAAVFLTAGLPLAVNGVVHGEPCSETDLNKLCDNGLTCIYETCSCLTGEGSEYDPTSQRCLSKINTPCGTDADCVSGGQCVELFCECQVGLSVTKDHHCSKSYESNCTTSTECNQDRNMVCKNSTSTGGGKVCGCANEETHFYEDATNKGGDFCSSKVGQGCDPYVDYYGFPNGDTGSKCVSGADCVQNTAGNNATVPLYVCQCPEGVGVSDDNTCHNSGSNLISFGFYVIISFIGVTYLFTTTTVA